jgi:histidyl-tRNA synthetase
MDFPGSDKKTVQPQQEGSFDQAKLFLWVKGLETKVNNLTREVDSIKNDFIRKTNDLKKEFKTLSSDLLEFKQDHEKTVEKADLIVKELKQTAGQEEVQTLKKYLELWNPMNFVTQRDLERTLNTKLEIKQKQVKEEKQSKEKHGPFR